MKILFFDPSGKYPELHQALQKSDHAVYYVKSMTEMEETFSGDPPDLILFTSDFQVSHNMELLQEVGKTFPRTRTFVVTANTDPRFLVHFIKLGIRQTFPGKLAPEELTQRIQKQIQKLAAEGDSGERRVTRTTQFRQTRSAPAPAPRSRPEKESAPPPAGGEASDPAQEDPSAQKLLEENIALREDLERRRKELEDREAYLEECENYLMEKSEKLHLREIELEQKAADLESAEARA